MVLQLDHFFVKVIDIQRVFLAALLRALNRIVKPFAPFRERFLAQPHTDQFVEADLARVDDASGIQLGEVPDSAPVFDLGHQCHQSFKCAAL